MEKHELWCAYPSPKTFIASAGGDVTAAYMCHAGMPVSCIHSLWKKLVGNSYLLFYPAIKWRVLRNTVLGVFWSKYVLELKTSSMQLQDSLKHMQLQEFWEPCRRRCFRFWCDTELFKKYARTQRPKRCIQQGFQKGAFSTMTKICAMSCFL